MLIPIKLLDKSLFMWIKFPFIIDDFSERQLSASSCCASQEGRMMRCAYQLLIVMIVLLHGTSAYSLPPVEGEVFGIIPITNEVSLYRNVDDHGTDRGETLQIIAINTIKIWTEFNFEFTGDFNWDMSYEKRDHYIELSLVKPVAYRVSLNYQRIISTFEDEPVNQFGIRFSF